VLKIKAAKSSGGKAGKGRNKTSTVQVVDIDKTSGTYKIVKQFRHPVGGVGMITAWFKADDYIKKFKERNKHGKANR